MNLSSHNFQQGFFIFKTIYCQYFFEDAHNAQNFLMQLFTIIKN
jgi:hypothetical protein